MEQLLTEKVEGQPLYADKIKTRVRVEHVFGFVENSMHGSIVRTIVIARALWNISVAISQDRCTQLKIVVAM
jgi:hypothetical protein